MKKIVKRLLIIALSLVMMLSQMTLLPAAATSNLSAHIGDTGNSSFAFVAGDTVTVTLKTGDMMVESFIGGLRFNKSFLKVESITGCRVGYSGVYLKTIDGKYNELEAEVSEDGTAVGFYYVNYSGVQQTYDSQDFINITFKTLKAGVVTFTLYEKSDGRDGADNNSINTGIKIHINEGGAVNPDPAFHINASSNRTNVNVGDSVKIKLTTNEMNVSTFTAGLKYDPEVFEYVGYSGFNNDKAGAFLRKTSGGETEVNVEAAKKGGAVGLFSIGSRSVQYEQCDLAIIELRAIKAGSSAITLYEDSDGYDAIAQDDVSTGITLNSVAKSTGNLIATLVSSEGNKVTGNLEVKKGGAFTVTLGTDAASISTFIGGINYNKDVLSVKKITGTRINNSGVYLQRTDGGFTPVETARNEARGVVSFTMIGTGIKQFKNQSFMNVTFEVISTGPANISIFEDSDGYDGYAGDPIAVGFSVTGTDSGSGGGGGGSGGGGGGSGGGGGGSGGSDEEDTEEAGDANVEFPISGSDIEVSGKSVVADITDQKAAEIIDSITADTKVVTISVDANSSNNINEAHVKLSTDILEKTELVNAKVEIETPTGSVELDADAARQILAKSGGKPITINIEVNPKTETSSYIECNVTISYGKTSKISKFGDGELTISLPIPSNLSERNGISAVYLNGKYVIDMHATVENGEATFTTNHLSKYAVMSKANADKKIASSVKKSTVGKLTVKAQAGKKMKLTWKTGKGNTPEGYVVYRSTKAKSGFKNIATVDGKKTYTVNTGLKKGKKYYYKVRGYVTVADQKVYTKYSSVKNAKCK